MEVDGCSTDGDGDGDGDGGGGGGVVVWWRGVVMVVLVDDDGYCTDADGMDC